MPNREFKYAGLIAEHAVRDCPPSSDEKYGMAFHWCHDPLQTPPDFTPSALKHPRRFEKMQTTEKCEHIGLSMFDSLDRAKEFYEARLFSEDIRKKIGEFVASGKITDEDGTTSDYDAVTGHFNLHEYVDTRLEQKFVVCGNI